MTNEKAIAILEEVKANNDGMSQYLEGFDEAFEIAVKAIKKQIPKKPFYTADDDTCLYTHYECPVCGSRLSKGVLRHCGVCGQYIDWSEEGE